MALIHSLCAKVELDKISEYHVGESYPCSDRKMPSKEEIKEVLNFTNDLFCKVCQILKIDKKDVMR